MRLYIAYWDTLGFECVLDLNDLDKRAMWATLADKPAPKLPVYEMIMRAKANPQRWPEIWTFQSELDLADILCYTSDIPQIMADLIRANGTKVFSTIKEKVLIK